MKHPASRERLFVEVVVETVILTLPGFGLLLVTHCAPSKDYLTTLRVANNELARNLKYASKRLAVDTKAEAMIRMDRCEGPVLAEVLACRMKAVDSAYADARAAEAELVELVKVQRATADVLHALEVCLETDSKCETETARARDALPDLQKALARLNEASWAQ